MTSFQNEGGMWTLASQFSIKEIASYMRCVSCAVLASDRNVRAEAELLGPVHESKVTPPEASKAYIRDSNYTGKIREHPIQFEYDDDHTEYADCVVDVRDVQRVKLVVWWLQIVAVRSLYLLGMNTLSAAGVQLVLSTLLTEKALTATGKPLPTVLEELAFSKEWHKGCDDEILSLLTKCQHLRKLQMHDYPLSTLDGIEKLTALEELHIDCRNIQHLGPLAACTRLQTLVLEDCHKIQSLDGLQNLSELTCLIIEAKKVTDLKQLKMLTQLRTLKLSGCLGLCSLEGVEGMTALVVLDLTNTKVSDLRPLKGCVRLEKLHLFQCKEVRSLAGLEGLTALTDLFASYINVDDLTPLAPCVRMEYLSLSGCMGVRSIEPLSGMTSLEILVLVCTSISDVAPLAGCVRLKNLNIGASDVCSVAALSGMTSLEILNLSETSVDDVAPLASLPALRYLDLTGTCVRDLRPLQHRIDEGLLDVEGFDDSDNEDGEGEEEEEEEEEEAESDLDNESQSSSGTLSTPSNPSQSEKKMRHE